ncbi:MAG: NAD(P)-dependent glycerol-3-phosphate dehydrogenase, partial [Mucispirillum sp.]|nr:NAD(P)-dependent glycerol-3-phosphate dehydrogenase [Mucispirillum sp.]
PLFLPDSILPDNLKARPMAEINECDADYYIWSVPSQYTRTMAKKYCEKLNGKNILLATKGVEISSGKLMISVISEEVTAKYSVLSGPSFAKELAKKKPTSVSVASYSASLAKWWQDSLSCDYFRVYTTDDMIGLEVGGAVKNVIAIATGLSDGMGLDHNARAALITRGLAEITRFGLAYGAKRETFVGLSGLGDLVLTCTGEISRNYSVGHLLAEGKNIEEITDSMKMVAEGVPTAKAVYLAAAERGVEMPICEEVYKIIYDRKCPRESVRDLMLRPLTIEMPY